MLFFKASIGMNAMPNHSMNIAVLKEHMNNLDYSIVDFYADSIQKSLFRPTLFYMQQKDFSNQQLIDYKTGAPISTGKDYVVALCPSVLKACEKSKVDLSSLEVVEIKLDGYYPELISSLFSSCPLLECICDEELVFRTRYPSSYKDPVYYWNKAWGIDLKDVEIYRMVNYVWLYKTGVKRGKFKDSLKDFAFILDLVWTDALDALQNFVSWHKACSSQVSTKDAIAAGNKLAEYKGDKLKNLISDYLDTLSDVYHSKSYSGVKQRVLMALDYLM